MFRLVTIMLAALFLISGCALFHTHPDEYKSAMSEGKLVADALANNVDRVATNNIKLVAKDTQALVDAGKMTAKERTKVIEAVAKQSDITIQQAKYITLVVDLAMKEAHGGSISEEDIKKFTADVKKVGKEIQDFIKEIKEK